MASLVTDKPRFTFIPDAATSSIKASNVNLGKLIQHFQRHALANQIPAKIKEIAYITFAQYPTAFVTETLFIDVVRNGDKSVIIINASPKTLKVDFENGVSIKDDDRTIYQQHNIALFIYSNNIIFGKAMWIWTQAMLEEFDNSMKPSMP